MMELLKKSVGEAKGARASAAARRAESHGRPAHVPRKRDFTKTDEPAGPPAHGRRPHAPAVPAGSIASRSTRERLHADLRLELDGVLVSWAVPKGPAWTQGPPPGRPRRGPPVEYGDFEGTIPKASTAGAR